MFVIVIVCAWKRRRPNMECKCKYTEWAVADSRQGVVPRCRLDEGLWIITADIHHFI